MTTIKKVIDFWKEVDLNQNNKIHPKDEVEMIKYIKNNRNKQEQYKHNGVRPNSLENIIEIENNATVFHNTFVPTPYLGNLKKAKVFYLTGNPGYMHSDHYHYNNSEDIISAMKNNLHQTNFDKVFDFFCLNPKFSFSGGYNYWTGKTKKIEDKIVELNHDSRLDFKEKRIQAKKLIAKKFAVLELTGYPSSAMNKTLISKLESTKLMVNFVKTTLIPRAENNEILIIGARSLDLWNLKGHKDVKEVKNRIASIPDDIIDVCIKFMGKQ